MEGKKSPYMGAQEIRQLLGVGLNKAYQIIYDLNQQAAEEGYYIPKRTLVSRKYFEMKCLM